MTANTPVRSAAAALALPMTLLTGAYLAFEIPFGALLLEIVSNGADADAISRLEHAGRLIAGAALALALLPYVLKRALRRGRRPGRALVVAVGGFLAVVAMAFVAQRVLVDSIAERSSAADRKAAVQALSIRAAFPADLSHDPATRAAAALAPLAAFVRPAALTDAGGLTELAREQALRAVGDAGELRRGAYADGLGKARELYAGYRATQDALDGAQREAGQASAKAWKDWYRWLDDHTYGLAMKWGVKSPEDQKNYARIVRDRGVPVPQGWYPLDEATFRAAAERAFLDRARKQAPVSDLPSGIASFDAFLRHPAVQARMRSAVGPIAASFAAGENADDTSFRTLAWSPAVSNARESIVTDATAPVASYADGGPRAALGKSAVRAIAVPPIALLLSLLGLTVHLFKFANYGTVLFARLRGRREGSFPLRHAAIALSLVAAVFVLRDGRSAASASAFWTASEPAIAARFGDKAAEAATFVIQMQSNTYPVSARIAAMPHFAGFARWVEGRTAAPPKATVVASR
jgi:hypothetical protein